MQYLPAIPPPLSFVHTGTSPAYAFKYTSTLGVHTVKNLIFWLVTITNQSTHETRSYHVDVGNTTTLQALALSRCIADAKLCDTQGRCHMSLSCSVPNARVISDGVWDNGKRVPARVEVDYALSGRTYNMLVTAEPVAY